MILILGCVSAFHGIGGSDYFIYSSAYNQAPTIQDFIERPQYFRSMIFSFEPGYIAIVSILKTCGIDFYGYIVIQSIVFYSCMYIGLRKFTKHWGLVMLVFMYKMFFYDTFVSMRQPLTIAGFFIILKYLNEGKSAKYFLGTIVLASIHNGAFILIPLYFIRFFKLTKRRILILAIVLFPTAILSQYGGGATINNIMSLINPAKGYNNQDEAINIAYTLEYYLLLVAVIYNYDKIILEKYGEFILKIFLVILPIVTLFSGVLILRRELDYFFPFYGIIGGYIVDATKKAKAFAIILFTAISYYGYQRYLTNFGDGCLIPYKTWMETRTN